MKNIRRCPGRRGTGQKAGEGGTPPSLPVTYLGEAKPLYDNSNKEGRPLMAYFSNGTEGLIYRDMYCDTCVHDTGDCPIEILHTIWNYESRDDTPEGHLKRLALDVLWPMEGSQNGQCGMYIEAKDQK